MTSKKDETFEIFEKRLRRKVPAIETHETAGYNADEFVDHFLRDLVAKRKSSQLTQQSMANILGTDQSFVSKLEKRKIEPTLFWLFRYADALDCGLDISVQPHQVDNDEALNVLRRRLTQEARSGIDKTIREWTRNKNDASSNKPKFRSSLKKVGGSG